MPEHRRQFSPQFKAEAVQMVISSCKAAGQPHLTICKCGNCQPQEHRGADHEHTIKAKSQQPETKRNVLVSGIEPRCAGNALPRPRNYSPPGKARSERLCELSGRCYCCTFVLYSKFEHSNFASDLWS